MKTVVINQPRYFPACNYFHRMAVADIFIYLDIVQYTSSDWENRNNIKTANGPILLTVPVIKEKHEKLIKDTKIANSRNWATKHLKAIQLNYNKAKYFDQYIKYFETVYSTEWNYLCDLNMFIIDFIAKDLGIKSQIIRASELEPKSKGQELLIELCNKVDGNIYISGPMGRNYINGESFSKANIKLYYHDYVYPVYPQLYCTFEPYMSVIDLLLNCGPESYEIIKKGNVSKMEIINKFV